MREASERGGLPLSGQGLDVLADGARSLGFDLSGRQLEQFQQYYETLVDWNSRINLTAITEYEAVQVRHFLDSLTVGRALLDELVLKVAEPPGDFSLVDVGTGAGFPGVPLKILWPEISLTLADSIGKKTTFLKELAQALGLDSVKVVTERAEEMGQDKAHRQHYSAATARAVAPLPVLCEYLLPLVRVGGTMLAPKKGNISQEIEGAKKAARLLGGGEVRLHSFTLAGEEEERFVVAVKKAKPTPSGYPRRVGLAKSRPLG